MDEIELMNKLRSLGFSEAAIANLQSTGELTNVLGGSGIDPQNPTTEAGPPPNNPLAGFNFTSSGGIYPKQTNAQAVASLGNVVQPQGQVLQQRDFRLSPTPVQQSDYVGANANTNTYVPTDQGLRGAINGNEFLYGANTADESSMARMGSKLELQTLKPEERTYAPDEGIDVEDYSYLWGLAKDASSKPDDSVIKSKFDRRLEMALNALESVSTPTSIEDGLTALGASMRHKPVNSANSAFNIARGVAGGFKAIIGGARAYQSGDAISQRTNEAQRQYEADLERARRGRDVVYSAMGGEMPDMGVNQAPANPNMIAEGGEVIQNPNGDMQEVEGKAHHEGGEPMEVEAGSMTLSNAIEVPTKERKLLEREFKIKTKAGDTYSEVLTKYGIKLGSSGLALRRNQLFKKMNKLESDVDFGSVSKAAAELNIKLYSKMLEEIEEDARPIEAKKQVLFDTLYGLQEASKEADAPKMNVKEQAEFAEFMAQQQAQQEMAEAPSMQTTNQQPM